MLQPVVLLLLLFPSCSTSQDPYHNYGNLASNTRRDISQSDLFSPSPAGYIQNEDGTLIKCTAGYYCNADTSDASQMIQCGGADVFCPAGSPRPTLVDTGYYSVGGADANTRTAENICEPGSLCISGVKILCPAGSYGLKFGETLSSCDGLCEAGYQCTAGSTSSKQIPCGDPNVYCSVGTHTPVSVQAGYYSTGGTEVTRTGESITEIGHYSERGIKRKCPAGRYGGVEGLSMTACEGECSRGYYCPPGSTHHSQNRCGSANEFCPPSSISPTRVWDGHYTTTEGVDECGPGRFRNLTNVVDATISPVQETSVTSTEVPVGACDLCPIGKYKHVDGDNKALCLTCPRYSTELHGSIEGFLGNSTKDRTSCNCYRPDSGESFEQLYFNVTTGRCLAVPNGFVSPNTHESGDSRRTRFEQFECQAGHWCKDGVRNECSPGTYGDKRRETNSGCSGLCDPGYYCGSASFSKRENKCGGAHLFCPVNSSTPTRVLDGYYTNEDVGEEVRSKQHVCPPGWWCQDGKRSLCQKGHFGSRTGNTEVTCQGKCKPGHYCTEGSVSSTQNKCGGGDRYCPVGSFEPTPVSGSYYTVKGQIDLYLRDKKDVLNETMSAQKVCEPGFWCKSGVMHQCPEGTWSNNYGMRDPTDCGSCEPGYYCPLYPQRASTDPMRHECGRVDLYCPLGSFVPTNVTVGHYTYGGDERNTTRVGETECEEGYYCKNGVKRICQAGIYGGKKGMTDERCEGTCPAGSMCPEGSVAPITCGTGEYSNAGAWMCNSCGADSQADGDDGSQRCKNDRKCCFY